MILREGSSPEGSRPASRLRDLPGSVTLAKAGGVEPVPAQPDAHRRAFDGLFGINYAAGVIALISASSQAMLLASRCSGHG
jgi:hypothetical protein